MTKMLPYIDDMRARLAEVADTEHTLIRALDEALSRVDQKLLDDVRSLAMDHEARRVAILTELQNFAARIGAFPAPREPLPSLEDDAGSDAASFLAEQESAEAASRTGDWRQAVSKIKDDLDVYFGRPKSPH